MVYVINLHYKSTYTFLTLIQNILYHLAKQNSATNYRSTNRGEKCTKRLSSLFFFKCLSQQSSGEKQGARWTVHQYTNAVITSIITCVPDL